MEQEAKRKPIQIAAVWCDTASIGCAPITEVIALCDDGTMWSLIQDGWTLLPPIPQDQPALNWGIFLDDENENNQRTPDTI